MVRYCSHRRDVFCFGDDNGIVQEITASTDANGNAVDVDIVELTEEGKAAAQQLDEAARDCSGDYGINRCKRQRS